MFENLLKPHLSSQIEHVWVAYSGGLDSTVLLHLAQKLRDVSVHAIHINHGWHKDAHQWESHCRQTCQDLAIPLKVERLVTVPSANKEEHARDARLKIYRDLLQKYDVVLTAHHYQDQVETFLLQLFRGAGLDGLSAMPKSCVCGKGMLLRPFLDIEKDSLYAYAKAQKLSWIDDPSNQDVRHNRNFLRHEVLPKIKEKWPSVDTSVVRAVTHIQNANARVKEQAQKDFKICYDAEKEVLNVQQCRALPKPSMQWLIKWYYQQLGCLSPSNEQIDGLIQSLLYSAHDKNPMINLSGIQWRRNRQHIYTCLEDACQPASKNQTFVLKDGICLEDKRWLKVTEQLGAGICLPGNTLCEVRYRQGGERVSLGVNRPHRSLKKWFNESGIPPWLRSHWPLIYYQERLVAVPGLGVAGEYQASAHEIGYVMSIEELVSALKPDFFLDL